MGGKMGCCGNIFQPQGNQQKMINEMQKQPSQSSIFQQKKQISKAMSEQQLKYSANFYQLDNASFQQTISVYQNCYKNYAEIQELGQGSYGQVLLVRNKYNNKQYAMKIIQKKKIAKNERSIKSTLLEKKILQLNDHPFILKLCQSFQTQKNLYLVLEYMPYGDIYQLQEKVGSFNENIAKFIVCQAILAIQYLHEVLQITYRDLKPENVLIDNEGYIKLADFGLAREIKDDKCSNKENVPLGTPFYLAPEVIQNKSSNKNVDLWAIGIFLFELLVGKPPFYSKNTQILYKLILNNRLFFPNYMSKEAQDLITKLLKSNPNSRIGSNGIENLKKHQFFEDVDWNQILRKEIRSPLIQYMDKPLYKVFRGNTIIESPENTNENIYFPQFSSDGNQQIIQQLDNSF